MLKDAIFQIKLLFQDFVECFNKHKIQESEQIRREDIQKLRSKVIQPSVKDSIPILPTSSIQTVNKFFESHRGLMHRLFVKKLNRAIEENKNVIELFRLENTPIVAKLIEKDYDILIDDALQYFIEKEDYEMANACQELKDKYEVNKLLKSTKK